MQIKGQEYKTHFFKDNRGFEGLTRTDTKDIFIKVDEDENETKKTIIHELLHAYFFECGLVGYCSDETLVHFLEGIYFDLSKNALDIFEASRGGEICD